MAVNRKSLNVMLLCAAWLGFFVFTASALPVFPVKYSANKRYLVDQNNVPFPILGRTSWFITSLSAADYQFYIDDTAARGYNAIEFHVVSHDPRGNNAPLNGNGDAPFLKRLDGANWSGSLFYGNINAEAPDFTTPNTNYWNQVDAVLAYAESKGILVFLFPGYVGFNGGDQGYMQELVANGPTKIQTYGTWIANRYKNQKNLVWMLGGDMGTSPHAFNTAQTAVENALLNGIKNVPGKQSIYFSAEWDSESIATDQTSLGSAMTLNGAYSWTGLVAYHGRRAYAHSPIIPAFLLEEPYDEEGSDGNGVNPSATQPVRRFQWWGWLSTIGGYISGNAYVWPFNAGWQNHLDTQGTRDMTRLNAFIGSIPWYNLVPSGLGGMRTLITQGGSASTNADYVAAAATPDGKLLVAYIPPAHSGPITVDMGAMSGLTRARWFDPTSAAYSDAGTALTNSGKWSFTPNGVNSVGANDWVLVLDVPDYSHPTLKISAPTGAALTNTTGSIKFTGTASDNASLQPITWSNDRGGNGTATGTASWTVPQVTLSPGLNIITITAQDSAGNSTQAFVSVLYRVPPSFTQQPVSQSIATNDAVTFSATASGDQPLKFQWRKNGGILAGATNATFTIPNVNTLDAGSYSVVVNNAAGTLTSSNAVLKVIVPPLIISQPLSRSVTVGGKVAFGVKATGTAPLYYQWRLNGADIPGATTTAYALSKAPTSAAGIYTVVVSNFAGVRLSSNAVLTVNVPPAFTLQPSSQPTVAGPTNLILSAAATGTAPLKFQWRKNGKTIVGETNTSLTVTNMTADATYSVLVANIAGSATSTNALLKVFLPPAITGQPIGRTVTAGGSASFSAKATGTAPLFYQWRRNGVNIGAATNLSYVLANIQADQAGDYSIVVSNFAGFSISTNAALTVNVPPAFAIQPASLVASLGIDIAFISAATGTAPLRYQWRKDGRNIVGATNAIYNIIGVTSTNQGNYSVVVANVVGSVTSSNALLTLLFPGAKLAVPEALPILNVTYADDAIVLSWGTNASGFTLQSTTNFSAWLPLPPPDVADGSFVVTNLPAGPARFYRLVK